MTDEIDKHVLKKYEIQQKLGKGVRRNGCACVWCKVIQLDICGKGRGDSTIESRQYSKFFSCRRTESYGEQCIKGTGKRLRLRKFLMHSKMRRMHKYVIGCLMILSGLICN